MILTLSTILITGISGSAPKEFHSIKLEIVPSFEGATAWLNTKPLSMESLRGKLVLVDFWTYTCINWRRTLPYIRNWAEKYKEHGLVVVGVHSPEFTFEHQSDNVTLAIKEMKISFPVAMDNNFSIWRSFRNQYWPALYLIDAKGNIRYQKFGEGAYEQSEMEIQKLLKELSPKNLFPQLSEVHPEGIEAEANWEQLGSAENFLGFERTQGFASPEERVLDKPAYFSVPKKMNLNQWAISGEWTLVDESIRSGKKIGKIIYRFHARDLHLIMGTEVKGRSVKFRVLLDGKPPENAHGLDVDSNGYGIVTNQRMYQIIRQQGPIKDSEFQIEFLDSGVEVFDFTFG